jgi:hypothetical protein
MAFQSLYKKAIYKGYINKKYEIQDTSQDSADYFRITNFPTAVGGGKYVFSLQGNPNTLRIGTRVDVEILDIDGNPIPSEVTSFRDRFNNHYVTFDIYDITTPGVATVTVVGVAAYDAFGKKLNANPQGGFNVKWTGRFNVLPRERNEAPILFDNPPEVGVAQVVISTRVPVTATQSAYNFSVFTSSVADDWRIIVSEFSGGGLNQGSNQKMLDPRVRDVYINTQQKSQTLNTIPPNVREFLGNAKNGNVVTANNQYNVILRSSTPRFTKEHEGGIFSFFSSESLSGVQVSRDPYGKYKLIDNPQRGNTSITNCNDLAVVAKGSNWTKIVSESVQKPISVGTAVRRGINLGSVISSRTDPDNYKIFGLIHDNEGLFKQLITYGAFIIEVLDKYTVRLTEPVQIQTWGFIPEYYVNGNRVHPFPQYFKSPYALPEEIIYEKHFQKLPSLEEYTEYGNLRQLTKYANNTSTTSIIGQPPRVQIGPLPPIDTAIYNNNYITVKPKQISNFTGSVVYLPPPISYVTSSTVSQSFLQITFGDLNPISGQVYRIKTSAKLGSVVGDYKLINDQIIQPVEYLTDAAYPNQTTRGRRQSDYKLIGYFESQSLLNDYWTFFKEYPNLIGVVTGSMWSSGTFAEIPTSYTQSGILTTQFNQNYPAKKAFTLSFEASLDPDVELEVYMNSDPINLYTQTPQTYIRGFTKGTNNEKGRYDGTVNRFGKLIGRLTNETNSRKKLGQVSFDFETDGSGLGRPVFRARIADNRQTLTNVSLNSEIIEPLYYDASGSAFVTNVSLKPLLLNGFTPNILQYAVPLPAEFVEASVLSQSIDFKLDYFDYTGKQSEYSTILDDIVLNYQAEVPSNTCQDKKIYFYTNSGYGSSSINTPPSS